MKESAIFVFSVIAIVFMQGRAVAQDFLISKEDTSCDFAHSNPLLFPNGSHGFLVVWADTRNGPSQYYAQQFDSLGDPVAKNFPIFSNRDVVFAPANSFLVENSEWVSYGPSVPQFDTYYLKVRLCKTDGTSSQPVVLVQSMSDAIDCIGVCLGYYDDLAATLSGYVSGFSDAGNLGLAKRDWNGNILWSWGNWTSGAYPDTISAAQFSLCFNAGQNLAAVWVNVPYQDPFADTTHQIMGAFFDKKGDTLAANVMLRSETPSNFDLGWWGKERVKVLPISNNRYEILDYDADAFTLHYWTVDTAGNRVGDMNELAIYHDMNPGVNQSQYTSNFGFTPVVNGKFSLLLTVGEYGAVKDNHYNSLLTFDTAGTLVGAPVTDSTSVFNIADNFFRLPDSTLVIPSIQDGDVYLGEYHGFTLTRSIKINDNSRGSNYLLTGAAPDGDGGFLATWKDEKTSFARTISGGGTPSSEVLSPGPAVRDTFANGYSLSLWTTAVSDSMSALGYTVYDKSHSPVLTDTLARNASAYWLSGVTRILPDTSFVILYNNGTALNLRHVEMNGEYTDIAVPAPFSGSWALKIIPESDSTFWIYYNYDIRLVPESLDHLGSEHHVGYFTNYLRDDKFFVLSSSVESYLPGKALFEYSGSIVSPDDSVLVSSFMIADSVEAITTRSLSSGYFALAYLSRNQVYIRTYDTTGTARIDPTPVSSDLVSMKTAPIMSQNGNNLLVAWSETRTPGNGYDVYGRIFAVDKLTPVKSIDARVPSRFTLYQNYPNPFNPSTTISYDIPIKAHVTVTIYNVLGEKIATLVDGVKNPGSYLTVFNGSRFASGVYFCRLTAGEYTFTRKLMMLK